jgi:crossover junction endodeoxyribonuclease RuvC
MTRVLGIDPALRNTGYGLIEVGPAQKLRVVTYGVIRGAAALRQTECLVLIHEELTKIIAEHQPDSAAVEGIIYLQNYRTAITLGAARAAALLAVSQRLIPIHEYAPRRIKAAATGRGGAQKAQVGFMMRALLGLTENPPADAADALAVAVTHAQSRSLIAQGTRL